MANIEITIEVPDEAVRALIQRRQELGLSEDYLPLDDLLRTIAQSLVRKAEDVRKNPDTMQGHFPGNTSLTLSQLPEDSPVWEFVSRIEASAARAAELTQQLLAYAGGEAAEQSHGYLQLFRDGVIETLDSAMLVRDKDVSVPQSPLLNRAG